MEDPGGSTAAATKLSPLAAWLASALEQERHELALDLERRHGGIVAGLQARLDDCPPQPPAAQPASAGRPPGEPPGLSEETLVTEGAVRCQTSDASSEAKLSTGDACLKRPKQRQAPVLAMDSAASSNFQPQVLPGRPTSPTEVCETKQYSPRDVASVLQGERRRPLESDAGRAAGPAQHHKRATAPADVLGWRGAAAAKDDDERQAHRVTVPPPIQERGSDGSRSTVSRRSKASFSVLPRLASASTLLSTRRLPGEVTPFSSRHLSFLKVTPSDMESRWNLRHVVESDLFEIVTSGVILANSVVFACEMQYESYSLGQTLEYRWHSGTSDETWPGAYNMFQALDAVFGVAYAVELCLKLIGLRRAFLRDYWNYFDATIVLLWVAHVQGTITQGSRDDNLLMLRLARVAKLFRLLRVVRTIHAFDSLYLMTTALRGSFWALAWSCFLLLVLQMLNGFLVHRVLMMFYFENAKYPISDRKDVFEYFGSFSRCMLSMFEMTLANWPPVCRLLVENVSEWWIFYCVLHKLVIGFAVIGVINGVFMQETFRVAATDDRIMMRQKQRDTAVHTDKITRLFKAADLSGDGTLDVNEFRDILENNEVQVWLASMEINFLDPDSLFRMVDWDGDGCITAKELVEAAARLKGTAKSGDLLALWQEQRSLRLLIRELYNITNPEEYARLSEKTKECVRLSERFERESVCAPRFCNILDPAAARRSSGRRSLEKSYGLRGPDAG